MECNLHRNEEITLTLKSFFAAVIITSTLIMPTHTLADDQIHNSGKVSYLEISNINESSSETWAFDDNQVNSVPNAVENILPEILNEAFSNAQTVDGGGEDSELSEPISVRPNFDAYVMLVIGIAILIFIAKRKRSESHSLKKACRTKRNFSIRMKKH